MENNRDRDDLRDDLRDDHTENNRMEEPTGLGSQTTNEVIRAANGDPDMDLNDIRPDQSGDLGTGRTGAVGDYGMDTTQGMSYNPNDTSGVRSGGITDMDDQTAGGAGANTGARQGLGSHLMPKMGTTGSDFDGQDKTS
ncbi:MAG TPA: hypothetical protein VHK69_17075 [Chitinophagaceae bacterium]|nr:hypothetical protein [Chitinophagaceae bacterium]